MKYVRPIIIIIIAFAMISEIFTKTYVFYGIGVGLLMILACEEIARDFRTK